MTTIKIHMALISLLVCIPTMLQAGQPDTALSKASFSDAIQLPPARTSGGMPLMDALARRKTDRAFSDKELDPQLLADLLWAAFGFNRPDSRGRTAPSARNTQEIDIYVATRIGLYLFDPAKSTLIRTVDTDIRKATGTQNFVDNAPVNLVYVCDSRRMSKINEDDRRFYTGINVGHISQNVYLFCAAHGLATVVRGAVDKEALAKAMKLDAGQSVVLAQTVGYPKEK